MKRTRAPKEDAKMPQPTGRKKSRSQTKPKEQKEKGTSVAKEPDWVESMTVNITGVREGEVLFGIQPATKGCVIALSKGSVPPRTSDLDQIRAFPELWQKFLNQLGVIDFFNPKTLKEREEWLAENQIEKDLDISECEGTEIEVLSLGTGKFLEALSEDNIETLCSGVSISAAKARSMFPAKPGSTGLHGRPTLMFYRHYWKIAVTHNSVKKHSGIILDLEKGNVLKEAECAEGQSILLFDDLQCLSGGMKRIGILVPNQGITFSEEAVFDILAEIFPDQTKEDMVAVKNSMVNFTAASFKSVIQKIIRFRPNQVKIKKDSTFPAEFVLAVACSLLMINPGSFVPDIQRFVTGLESVVKRLVVIFFEDSCFDPTDCESVLKLAIGAFLAQRAKRWRPTKAMVIDWIRLALQAWKQTSYFNYNIEAGLKRPRFQIDLNSNTLAIVSALLDEVKSFSSDLAMIRDIAANFHCKITKPNLNFPTVMPLCHCVDQHWAPDIAYFFSPNTAKKYQVPGSKPFSKLLKKLFDEVTGFNPRKGGTFSPNDFIKEARMAQKLMLVAKQYVPVQRKSENLGERTLVTKLDKSWLAGMAGATEMKGKPPVLVTLRPDDAEQLVAIRKPARDMKDANLTSERQEKAIADFKKLLHTEGVPLKAATAPIPQLQKAKLKLDSNEEYVIITKDGKEMKWEDFEKTTATYSLLSPLKKRNDPTSIIISGLTSVGEGVEQNADTFLNEYLEKLDEFGRCVMRRVLMYISVFKPSFELNRLTRDGGAAKLAVVIEDVQAYHFLLLLSTLYPSALTREKFNPLKFCIPSGPLLWEIKKMISLKLASGQSYESKSWGELGDITTRKMWEHQHDSLKEMKAQHAKGKKGHFLWIPVGMGKTLIVFSYLKYLQEQNQLPQYILYTLPGSAIKSIIEEIKKFGFKDNQINLIIPTQNAKTHSEFAFVRNPGKCVPHKFCINLIEHDHLRSCKDELSSIAPHSIFIMDEVHKALNETLRTAAALQLSHVAEEFIALTGTPVIDSNTYKLIWWLEQIASFEVNEKNFWVAANCMVAKKVCTGVIVDRQEVEAPLGDKEDLYKSLMPRPLGGTKTNATMADLYRATEICYQICTAHMVSLTLDYLKEGRGVMLVAKDSVHQQELFDSLLKSSQIAEKDIFQIDSKHSIFLTDAAVQGKQVHDYKVVITTIRKSEGYTLTRNTLSEKNSASLKSDEDFWFEDTKP